jgi:hypothetical protein
MTITSHTQKIIQIYPCLLKLSRKQESVTDAITISPHRYRGGGIKTGVQIQIKKLSSPGQLSLWQGCLL